MRRAIVALAALAVLAGPASAQIDGSGTITTGGTSQVALPARDVRQYLFCENPIAAVEALYVNTPGNAAVAGGGSYELAPGGSITFVTPGFVPPGAASVVAATTGHRFICKTA